MQAQGEHANSTETGQPIDSNPELLFYEATVKHYAMSFIQSKTSSRPLKISIACRLSKLLVRVTLRQ